MTKKVWFNMAVNALSLMVFALMISTGMLLKFVLPPRSGHVVYWGLERHEWGQIHFYIALAFLILLILHLILHWSWIQCIAWGTKAVQQSKSRKLITIGIIGFIIVMLSLPWIGKRQEAFSSSKWAKRNEVLR